MPRSRTSNWSAIFVTVLAGVLVALHFGKVAPVLSAIETDLQLDMVVAGWVISMFSATGALVGVGVGAAADSLGARRVLLLGLLTTSIASLLGAVSVSATGLLISRFCEGLGFIAVAVSAPIIVVRSVDTRGRGLALGLWTTYVPIGLGAAMLLAPVFVAYSGWREWWIATSVSTLICAVLVIRMVPADHRDDARTGTHGFLHNLRMSFASAGSWLLSLAFLAYTVQWISVMAWLPSFLNQGFALDAVMIAVVAAIVVLFNIPGNLCVSWLLAHGLERWQVLLLGGAGMALGGTLLLTPGLGEPLQLAAALVFSGLGGLIPGAVLTGAPEVAPGPAQIGSVNGMMVQGAHLGQWLGPPALAAVVAIRGEWSDTRWLLGAACAVIAMLAILYRTRERRFSRS